MNDEFKNLKVAVIHDWLSGMRGGEIVLEAILDLFPDADLYTLLYNKGSVSEKIANRNIYTSYIDRLPFKSKGYRNYLPLFPSAIERFDFHGYDLVVSSSHCVARGVIVPPDIAHVSFIHSPMRYVWDMFYEYFPPRGLKNRLIIPYFAGKLRTWDAAAAPRVDRYVCNSSFVAARVRRYYGRQAAVVFPPCLPGAESATTSVGSPVPQIDRKKNREDFFLIVSALVPYKRVDLAVRAFHGFRQELYIVGDGPEKAKLEKSAPPNVRFLGSVDRATIIDLYRRASALIFPGTEDFGIVPVEAQACGCPVIAYRRGGALETVKEGKTGLFFEEQSEASIRDAVMRFFSHNFKASDFRTHVKQFSHEQFLHGFAAEVRKAMKGEYL